MLLLFLLPVTLLGNTFGPDFLRAYEPGPTQYISIISAKGPGTDRVSFKSNLSAESMEIVEQFLSSNPNPYPQLGERYYDHKHYDQTFSSIYGYNKSLELFLFRNQTYKKKDILQQLGQRFNDTEYIHTIVYYSGQAEQYNGGWIIAEKEEVGQDKWDYIIAYRDLVGLWKQRTDKISSKHLHIIIQSSYSGRWAHRCFTEADFLDLSIMAATGNFQKAYDIGIGGCFTYNIMQSIRPFQPSKFVVENDIISNQPISGMGFGSLLNFKFQLRLYYQTWYDIFYNENKTITELFF